MSRFYTRYTNVAVLAASILFAAPLGAQQRSAPGADANITDELIVRSLAIPAEQFTLLSTTNVIDEKALRKAAFGSLGDIMAQLSGVDTASYGRATGRPVIRGLGGYRVAVLEQGLPSGDVFSTAADHANTQNPLSVSRLEVLKGPAALRYGPYAATGVINMLDLPQADALPGISGEYRVSYNTVAYETAQSGFAQYVRDASQFRLGAYHRKAKNYKIPNFAETAAQRAEEEEHAEEAGEEAHGEPARGSLPDSDVEDIGTSLIARHDGGFWDGQITYHYNQLRYGVPAHVDAHGEEEEEHEEGEEHAEEHGDEHGAERTALHLARHRVLASGRYEFNNTLVRETQLKLAFTHYDHEEIHGAHAEEHHDEDEEEHGEEEEHHDAGIGFEIKQNTVSVRNEYVLDLLPGADSQVGWSYTHSRQRTKGEERYIPSVTTQQFGLYTTHAWSDAFWLLEGAARFDWETHKPTDMLTKPISTYEKAAGAVSLGAGIRPMPDVIFGGSVSYSQRVPAVAELFADGTHTAVQRVERGSTALDPEGVVGLELYARWRQENIRVALSAYYNEFDDFIYAQRVDEEAHEEGEEHEEEHGGGLPVVEYRQRAAVIQGLELEAYATLPLPGEFEPYVGLRASLLEGRFKNAGYIPQMPPMQFAWTLGTRWRQFDASLELTHALEQDKPGLGERATPSYVSLDAQLHWQPATIRGVRWSLIGRNLTDEEIRHHTSALKERAPEPGRSISLTAALLF